jgi:energy-coupling factor transporter transmembrane protein EcfT
MQNLLYTIAIVFVLLWFFGFLVYNLGAMIHILLLIAVVAILLKIIKGEEV